MNVRVPAVVASSFVVALLAGCSNAGGGGPVPQPGTARTTENFFPLADTSDYQVMLPPNAGLTYDLVATGPNGEKSPYSPTCSASVGTFGDYQIDGQLFVPDREQGVSMLGDLTLTYTDLLLTKDAAGNAYVVGQVVGNSTGTGYVSQCTTPYLLIGANPQAGAQWSYTDIAGKAVTASVVFAHQTKSYAAYGAAPAATYSDVTEIAYGKDFSIDWAAGYGPVLITEHTAVASQPLSYLAYDFTVVASSN